MRSIFLMLAIVVLGVAHASATPADRYIWLIDRAGAGLFYEQFAQQMATGPHKDMLAGGKEIETAGARPKDLIVQLTTVETKVGDVTVTTINLTFLQYESPTTYFYFGQYMDTYNDKVSMDAVASKAAEIANERLTSVMKAEAGK
jgi:hypothetical protein